MSNTPPVIPAAPQASADVLAHWQKLEGQVRRMQQIVREYADQLAAHEQQRQSQIEQARTDIRKEITDELTGLRNELQSDRARLDQRQAELDAADKQLADRRAMFDADAAKLVADRQQVEQDRSRLDADSKDVAAQHKELDAQAAELQQRGKQLDADRQQLDARAAELQAQHEAHQRELDQAAAMLSGKQAALDSELEQELARHEQQLQAIREGQPLPAGATEAGADVAAYQVKIHDLQQQEKQLLERIDDLARRLKNAEQKHSSGDNEKKTGDLMAKLERREQRIRQVEKDMAKRRARLRLYKDILDARSQRLRREKSDDTLVGEEALGELEADPTESLLVAPEAEQEDSQPAAPVHAEPSRRKGGMLSWLKNKTDHAEAASVATHDDDDTPEFKPL